MAPTSASRAGDDHRGGHRCLVPTASRTFAITVTITYLVILGVALVRHELWRDELQAWMLARDSASPIALIHNMRYEGHPPLWHLLLWLVSRVTRAPRAMQLVQWVVAVTWAYLVARFAPAPRWAKVLVLAGYYMSFEYAVISRSYGLGLLLLLTACVLLCTRQRGYGALALVLTLLALTSVYGLLLAAAFGSALAVDAMVDRRLRMMALRRWPQLAVTAVVAAVLAGSVALMRPAADAPFTGTPHEGRPALDLWALATSGSLVWRAYAPIPDPAAREPWNSNIVRPTTRPRLALGLGLSVLLVMMVLPLVARRPAALTFYILATGVLLAFSYLHFFGTQRHHGHIYLALLVALWLARSQMAPWPPAVRRLVPPTLAGPALARVAAVGTCALLGMHVLIAARMYAIDLREPFSGAEAVAIYVRDSLPAGTPVAARPSPQASSVSALLDRPILYLDDGEIGTFIVWGPGRRNGFARGRELPLLLPLLPADGGPMALVLNYPLEDPPPPGVKVRPLTHAPSAFVTSENFYLYEVRRVAHVPADHAP